jgi:hypothetical protein
MAHRYLVEWSAPDYRNAKDIRLLADNKVSAIKLAKKKLGNKVKKQHLHNFYAIKISVKK